MKKILLIALGTVALLALVAYVTLQFFLGSIVKAGVNKFGPTITQTAVNLEGASISPLSGAGTLTGLTVANPAGWSPRNAFALGRVHVDMEPFSVFGDHIVINEIVIEAPEFSYETKIVSSNINDLLKNIEKSMGAQSGSQQPKAKNGQPLKLEIKKFVLRDGKVTLGVAGTAVTMPMPPIELTNLGTAEGGITPAAVTFAVMRSVTASVVTASTEALSKVGGTSGAAAAEAAKQAGEAIKGWFGGKKK
ncbi:hypothetical protein [Opitutus sp. ER46]|uniref:DUF748 domain-containing protein n=1 Tax=Opitutus sp. ER46 TaxID=2161864 RepID=UPI000D2F8B74|nr:hypothetical protein [Opitutus sp. ER46]PTX92478.1 hypothetical protein DB354_14175 [Opitutus sp. ER46]